MPADAPLPPIALEQLRRDIFAALARAAAQPSPGSQRATFLALWLQGRRRAGGAGTAWQREALWRAWLHTGAPLHTDDATHALRRAVARVTRRWPGPRFGREPGEEG